MPTADYFTIIDTVDSTNNYAMAKVHAGLATHGMAWLANEQTAGKGQRGKGWDAESGKNITLSIVIQPEQLNASQQFYLIAAIALGCFEFFDSYAGGATKIKWPNDLYWRDRKAGGILIETIYHGRLWKWAVAGIGININQDKFEGNLKNPVSLKQITGINYDVATLARELHKKVMKKVDEIKNNSKENLLNNYNQQLYKLDEKIKLKKANIVFETRLKSVNSSGQLITSDTIERQFDHGDVAWVGE